MPSGRASSSLVGLGEYDYLGRSVGDLRLLFLLTIRRDVPHALDALADVDSDSGFKAWAVRFNITDPWLIDVAQRTLTSGDGIRP